MILKSLNSSFLTDSDVIKLRIANIHTTEQLITHADLETLSRQTGIQVKNLKLVKKFIIGQYSPFPEQSNVLFDKFVKNLFIVKTGCKEIDYLISNGFYSNEISEITGTSSTGKTQFCFQLIANMITEHPDFTCQYIDSNKNFCSKRLNDLICHKLINLENINIPERLESSLKSIKVIDCLNVFNLIDILYKFTKTNNESNNSENIQCPNLLIIDNFTNLFNQFKTTNYSEINFYLNYISTYLKYLAINMKIMIIIVTNRTNNENSNNSFNLTNNPIWINTPNLIVCLKNLNEKENNKLKKFEIIKQNRPFLNDLNKSFSYFSINNFGLQ